MATFSHLDGIKAVVFDVYGTLVEIANKRWPYRLILDHLAQSGRVVDAEARMALMSHPVGLEEVASRFDAKCDQRVLAEAQLALNIEIDSIHIFPDVITTLENLREQGFKIGVCSNLALPYADPVQRLIPFIMDAYGWSFMIGAVKPDPKIYSWMSKALGCDANEILFVGDTPTADYEGPLSAGMRALLLDRKAKSNSENVIESLSSLT